MGSLRTAFLSGFGIVVALAAADVAFAQQRVQSGPSWYLGVGGGISYYKSTDQDFNVPSVASQGFDETGVGWKLFGGYRFSPYFGLEGAYVDLGRASGGAKYAVHSWDISAVGRIPFASGFSLQGKIGAAFNRAEGFGDAYYRTGLLAGVGVGYELPNGFGLLAEYEYLGRAGDATTCDPIATATACGTGRSELHFFSVSGTVRF